MAGKKKTARTTGLSTEEMWRLNTSISRQLYTCIQRGLTDEEMGALYVNRGSPDVHASIVDSLMNAMFSLPRESAPVLTDEMWQLNSSISRRLCVYLQRGLTDKEMGALYTNSRNPAVHSFIVDALIFAPFALPGENPKDPAVIKSPPASSGSVVEQQRRV